MHGGQNNEGKIDIVYLWVDGADPHWRKKHQQAYARWARQHPGTLAIYGNAAGRYRDNGEFMFNLRALEKFFPDHGHVYIVTDNQVPAWLRRSERVTIIDHRDLMPAAALPVFDSGHIESYLHHIPGLSERFFYLNDDVFFGANVDTDWWFGERLMVLKESLQRPDYADLQVNETALVNGSILSKNWLSARDPAYAHDTRIFAHSPRPMLKSAMQELEVLAAELFSQVRSTVFRSWRVPPLLPDLVPRWMVARGYAQQRILDPLYISTGDAQAEQQLSSLLTRFGQLPFFCINDTCDEAEDDDLRLLRVAMTLEKLLPTPSSFEKACRNEVVDLMAEAA